MPISTGIPPGPYRRNDGSGSCCAAWRLAPRDSLAKSCYRFGVQDTSAEAARIQAAVHRKMGGVRRFLVACKLSDSMRSIARERVRSRHPDFDEVAVRDELLWELYGIRRGS